MDIMFVDSEPFLISVSQPLGLTMVNYLENEKGARSVESVKPCVLAHINAYKARGFNVTHILNDGEGAVKAIESDLNNAGVILNPAGPNQHVPVVENKIRQIKNGVRSHITSLPFKMPLKLIKFLVFFVVSRSNLMPSGTRVDPISPSEVYHGRKVDFKRDLRVSFGDYVQTNAPIPDNTKSSVSKDRTEGAIALYPLNNEQGSVHFLHLKTFRVIVRDKWTPLPMPSIVVDYINDFAEKNARASNEPVFQAGSHIIEDYDYDQDDETIPLEIIDGRPITEPQAREVPPIPTIVPGDDDNDGSSHPFSEAETVVNNDFDVNHDYRGDISSVESTHYDHGGGESNLSPPNFPANQNPIRADDNYDNVEEPDPFGNILRQIQSNVDSDNDEQDPSRNDSKAIDDHDVVVESSDDIVEEVPPSHQYNLRSRSKADSTREYGLHITVRSAINKFGKTATRVIADELQQMLDKKVWTPVEQKDLSPDERRKSIRSSMFLKEKYLPNGDFDKLKARLVAGGHMQDKSLYDDISSPTVQLSSVFILAGLAAKEKRSVTTIDIGGAYLNAHIKSHKIIMVLDKVMSSILSELDHSYQDYLREDGTMFVRLDRALYGCVESAKLWYEHLRKTLEDDGGYKRNPYDKCVFNKVKNGKQCTICVYVDDLLVTSQDDSMIDELIQILTNRYKEIKKTRGDVHSYLGMTLIFNPGKSVKVAMDGYVQDVLKLYDVKRKVATPATEDLFKVTDSPKLPPDKREEFHSRVAKLLYLAKRVRPDLLTMVIFLATRVQCATEEDWSKLERGLAYLNSTSHLSITLVAELPLTFYVYADAAYGVHGDGKGHEGIFITAGKAGLIVISCKQKIVVKSICEGELVAASDSVSPVIALRNFMIHQGYNVGPSKLYQDNKGTISLIDKGCAASARTRHINVRYFFIKDRVDAGEVEVEYKPTGEMIADILTKPLQGELFRRMRRAILNCDD
jgi:hypothetical protein